MLTVWDLDEKPVQLRAELEQSYRYNWLLHARYSVKILKSRRAVLAVTERRNLRVAGHGTDASSRSEKFIEILSLTKFDPMDILDSRSILKTATFYRAY